jgi:hypothetical protein
MIRSETHKAVTNGADLLVALLLQVLDGLLDDGVDSFVGVRVVTAGTLGQPGHEVKVLWLVQGQWVAVEQVRDDGVVAIGGELVSHQLAVLPDTDDVWEVQNGGVLVDDLALGLGNIGLNVVDFDGSSGRLTSVVVSVTLQYACGHGFGGLKGGGRTHA